MRGLLILLGWCVIAVGCRDGVDGKITPFNVGDSVMHRSSKNPCTVVKLDRDSRRDIRVECQIGGDQWGNSYEYEKQEETANTATIPESLIQTICKKGEETRTFRGLDVKIELNGGAVDSGFICTVKKVSLKYE